MKRMIISLQVFLIVCTKYDFVGKDLKNVKTGKRGKRNCFVEVLAFFVDVT